MKLLLDDRMAPITSEIGFIEIDYREAARAFAAWQAGIIASHGGHIRTENVALSSLEQALQKLLPLTTVLSTRSLFIPTQGQWVAFFENRASGGDAFGPMSYLAKLLGCRGLRVVAVPDTTTKSGGGRYGATILEIYGPDTGEFLNYVRSIAAVNDGGRWEFVAAGTPQYFEEVSSYKARTVRDRFTFEMLYRYLQALGLDAFDDLHYRSTDAILVERRGALPNSVAECSLEEARAKLG